MIATAVSFVGNALWSFGARPTPGKAAWFFAINTVGLCLNMLIAWVLERLRRALPADRLTVLIIVPMFNFAGHRLDHLRPPELAGLTRRWWKDPRPSNGRSRRRRCGGRCR